MLKLSETQIRCLSEADHNGVERFRSNTLRSLERLGLLRCDRDSVNHWYYCWETTQDGLDLLEGLEVRDE
jgi:hypothetical protein